MGASGSVGYFISVLLNEKKPLGAICKEGAPTAFYQILFSVLCDHNLMLVILVDINLF